MKSRDARFYLNTWTPATKKTGQWQGLRSFWAELKRDVREMGQRPATAVDYVQLYFCVMVALFLVFSVILG